MSGSQKGTIQANAVTDQSLIQVRYNDDYAPASRYWISAKFAGNLFMVKLDQAVS